jgi:hypothetical protein
LSAYAERENEGDGDRDGEETENVGEHDECMFLEVNTDEDLFL